MTRSPFRPDVEGLRAVAIGLVILAHAGVPFAAGGFVGVDVFFVIPGFLITRLLIGELDRTHSISLATFYARRIKRLLPQAALAVTVVVLAAWALLSPMRAQAVSHDVMAAGGYMINWHYAAQSMDYFAAGDADRPLDHFWSLAVEEQYYVVWPLLLLGVTRRWRAKPASAHRALGLALAAIVACSLLYAVRLVVVAPEQAYFSTPARAWELGLGGLLAVAPLGRLPGAPAAVLAWCGFAAIAAATLAFGPTTPFPGAAALLPTLGAAALVVAGARTAPPLPTRLLSLAPMQALGRMSYAWYVWHWPVLVFAAAALGPPSLPGALAITAASLVPTVVSYRWIEEPVRRSDVHRRRPRLTLAAAPLAAALFALLGIGLAAAQPTVRTSPPGDAIGAAALGRGLQTSADALSPTPQDADSDRSRAYADGCLVGKSGKRSPACVYGDPAGAETVVIFGDSHAMQYFPAIERIASERHWRLVELTKSGCPAARVQVRDYLLGRAYTECDVWREDALRRLVRERPQIVITSGTATYAVLQGGRRLSRERSRAALVAGYRRVLAQLPGTVIAIHDTPQPPFDVPSCVADAMKHLRRCAFSKREARPPGDPVSVAARAVPGVRLLDPVDQLCIGALCPAVVGNVLVYRQSGHMTATYVATMTPWFERRIP
jgi:peptidoglycan/LPS O-acetylase OafA/YrhL